MSYKSSTLLYRLYAKTSDPNPNPSPKLTEKVVRRNLQEQDHLPWDVAPYRRRSSLGWFRFSRFFSMRSASSCLSTTVAYSILPCSAAMRRDATLPRSRMEKDLCASSVWMNIKRNILLWSSWLKRRKAFSTFAGDCREKEGGGGR